MRDTWQDYLGRTWPIVTSRRRLKFGYPAHAALRQHVHYRDGFCCVRCGARAVAIPSNYDGTVSLETDTLVSSGFRDRLILDHRLTLLAGGLNTIENLQTLCETCNRRKQPEDRAAVSSRREIAVGM